MSFLDKQKYILVDNRHYFQDNEICSFYMSQFPSNTEIYEALIKNKKISAFSSMDEYSFKRLDDQWYKPTIQIIIPDDEGPICIWEIKPC